MSNRVDPGRSAGIRCSGKTRANAPCRGHARYMCACGRRWCGTHVTRIGSTLTCPVCGRPAHIAPP